MAAYKRGNSIDDNYCVLIKAMITYAKEEQDTEFFNSEWYDDLKTMLEIKRLRIKKKIDNYSYTLPKGRRIY